MNSDPQARRAEIHAEQGERFWLEDRPDEALHHFQQAVRLAPEAPAVYVGLGNVYRDLNDFEAAERAYRHSRRLCESRTARCNLGHLLVGLESYAEAYALVESRFEVSGYLPYRALSSPLVLDREGKDPVRVWSEQGFGDSFQYVRWIPCLRRRLGNRRPLLLEVEPALVRVLEQGLAWMAAPPAVMPKQEGVALPLPAEGAAVSLLSLPHHLGGAPWPAGDPMPGRAYLCSDLWQRHNRRDPPVRIGLTWASGRKLSEPFFAREYRKRTLPQADLNRLVEGLLQRQVDLVGLQQGPDQELAAAHTHRFVAGLGPADDFARTAELIAGCDLVISVDTAVAHLAGAMGHPTWVLLPARADPRWLRARTDTPWYRSLRLFRQQRAGVWADVVEEVIGCLPQGG